MGRIRFSKNKEVKEMQEMFENCILATYDTDIPEYMHTGIHNMANSIIEQAYVRGVAAVLECFGVDINELPDSWYSMHFEVKDAKVKCEEGGCRAIFKVSDGCGLRIARVSRALLAEEFKNGKYIKREI